jgi:GT2 family glycosyltransferase
LASFSQQTLLPSQIIVVDNASTDGRTCNVAQAAGAQYVREDRLGLDIARNVGARVARGEIIAYTDDDVILHPRWLERLVNAFDAPEVMAVTGLVLPAELETEAQRHFETYWGFGRGYRRKDFGTAFFSQDRKHGCRVWEIGAGANMAFRREVFELAGYFDERLDVGAAGCSGDSEYWHRVLTHGGICRYEPSAVVFHYHRRDFPSLGNQIFNYMRGHTVALLVQFERSGNFGNLRRAFFSMPGWYARRLLRRMLKGPIERDRFFWREFTGFLSGLGYYFRYVGSSRLTNPK